MNSWYKIQWYIRPSLILWLCSSGAWGDSISGGSGLIYFNQDSQQVDTWLGSLHVLHGNAWRGVVPVGAGEAGTLLVNLGDMARRPGGRRGLRSVPAICAWDPRGLHGSALDPRGLRRRPRRLHQRAPPLLPHLPRTPAVQFHRHHGCHRPRQRARITSATTRIWYPKCGIFSPGVEGKRYARLREPSNFQGDSGAGRWRVELGLVLLPA